jgi:hypothetical protein
VIRALVPVALVALLVGCTCGKVDEPTSTQSNLAPTPPSATSAKAAPKQDIDLDSLPVNEDYELEAEKAITPKTLLEKVDELEKEISKK